MILVLLLLIDQALKFFTLSRHFAIINKGIAFGLLSSSNVLNFLILICIFSFFIFHFSFKKPRNYFTLPVKLILLGGVSNLLDRILYGGVVDYLHLPLIPSFNLADLGITLGFILLLFKLFNG